MRAPTSNPRSVRTALALLLGGTVGCPAFGSGDPGLAECRVRETTLADDAQASPALGFAPEAVMSWARGERTAAARWLPPGAGTRANATGETALTLAIERADGPAVELVGEEYCGGKAIRIPIALSVRTEDGALRERLTGSLIATNPDFARVDATLDLGNLDGTLVYGTDDPRRRLVQPAISAVLNRDGQSGAVGAGLEERSGGGVSLLPLAPLLTWPADSACGSAEISRAMTGDWQVPVENASIGVWRRPDATDGGAHATVGVVLNGQLCDAEDGSTTVPATVSVEYGAGTRVAFAARFARVDDRFELQVPPQARLHGAPADFAERIGDFDLELAQYEHVQLEIELVFYPENAMVAHDARGVLTVVGYRNDCKPVCTATMCSGCGPSERVVLFTVALDGRL